MSEFAVQASAVQQASSMTQQAAGELAAELAVLRRAADAVVTGDWGGRAAAAFDRAWLSWHEGARAVVAALDDLAEALAVTGRAYSVRDEVVAAGLRQAAP